MALTAEQIATGEALLATFAQRVPESVRDKLVYIVRQEGNAFILYESRPWWSNPEVWHDSGVAKFTYVQSRQVWKLHRRDRNLNWHWYERLPESISLAALCDEVHEDPWHYFWG